MQVTVGRVGRAHGIRGDVVVGVRTDEPGLRFAAGSKLDTDPAAVGPLTVAAARWQSGDLIVRFTEVKDRTAAEALRGTWLCVDAGSLPPPSDPDEFRDHDLIGLTVRTASGAEVGEVADVLHHGQDLLAIRPVAGSDLENRPADSAGRSADSGPPAGSAGRSAASAEILVPFVKAIVTDVDLAAGTLTIDPPPGLLDANAP
ncbi:MAG: ribosome maturation factor RimM [Nocardiopsaceae bacterium]|nr:ribosome maturation factor RimM [Nocardiopsaceae bacterium]